MKPSELKNINESILKLKQNFGNSSDWSENIINASAKLTTKNEWIAFYHYLASPSEFDITKINFDCDTQKKQTMLEFKDLDKRLTPVIYKNGSECVIHLKHVSQDDEKCE